MGKEMASLRGNFRMDYIGGGATSSSCMDEATQARRHLNGVRGELSVTKWCEEDELAQAVSKSSEAARSDSGACVRVGWVQSSPLA